MKRKDAPELYEVLKKGNVDITKLSSKDESEPAIKEEGGSKIVELKPLPLAATTKPVAAVFPKLKGSFIKKPTTVTGDKQFIVSYNTAIFVVLIAVLLLAAAFVIGIKIGENNTGTTTVSQSGKITPPPTVTKWVIRLAYYDSNSSGKKLVNQLTDQLKKKKFSNISTGEERIQGRSQICVYVGPYTSENEADNTLKKLKSELKNIDFSNSKVVKAGGK